MNTLGLVALGLMLVAGALLLVSVFGLRICVQHFARSHDLRFASFIQQPYWLLFVVSIVFMLPPFVLDGDGGFKSLFDILAACIFTSGAIGFVVSLFWMAIAAFLSLFRQFKFKH
jgi:hypothetical protein